MQYNYNRKHPTCLIIIVFTCCKIVSGLFNFTHPVSILILLITHRCSALFRLWDTCMYLNLTTWLNPINSPNNQMVSIFLKKILIDGWIVCPKLHVNLNDCLIVLVWEISHWYMIVTLIETTQQAMGENHIDTASGSVNVIFLTQRIS